MSLNINDLPFELLSEIFILLPFKQQFVVESVCLRWKECVRKLMELKKTFNLKSLGDYSDMFLDQEYRCVINDNNFYILKSILTKCPNINQLDFNDATVQGWNHLLLSIGNLCPKLKTIYFNDSIKVSQQEINEFAQIFGSQLIKLSIGHCNYVFADYDYGFYNYVNHRHYYRRQHNYQVNLMVLIKQLKNIEDIGFQTKTIQEQKELFHYLNSECKNLKVLHLKSYKNHDFQDQDLIDVMHRIKHLKTHLSNILKFHFDLNNLTELSLNGQYVHQIINEMTFANVAKLNLDFFGKFQFYYLSEFKFPKLEFVSMKEIRNFIPTSFINQIKHIKTLHYYDERLIDEFINNPLLLSSLTQLVDLVWTDISLKHFDADYYKKLFQCFTIISEYKSFKKIKLGFIDSQMKINKNFYELLNFSVSRSITEIVIQVYKDDFDEKFNDYKMAFEETKHLHKLNMKLILNADLYPKVFS